MTRLQMGTGLFIFLLLSAGAVHMHDNKTHA